MKRKLNYNNDTNDTNFAGGTASRIDPRLCIVEPCGELRFCIVEPHMEVKRLTKGSYFLLPLVFPRMATMAGQLSFMCLWRA